MLGLGPDPLTWILTCRPFAGDLLTCSPFRYPVYCLDEPSHPLSLAAGRVVTYWDGRGEPSRMTTFEAGDITLHKVRDYVWEMPPEGGMGAPARVFASEALLEEIADDKSLQQLRDTTHLPGVEKYAVCMPDGHQGYGFPVGGVAGIDAENGCISPGAVGYDINCLTGDAEVSVEFGRKIKISDLQERFEDESAVVAAEESMVSDIRLFTENPSKSVNEVKTETGDTVKATPDHKFRTPEGMTRLSELEPGDTVLVHPFEGIEDQDPEEFTVLTEEHFADEDPQLIRVLKERNLLPLKSTDEAFNHLLKLVGFHMGDGAFGSHGQTWFYGEPEDLESVRKDIRAVGFKPSKIYSRKRKHEFNGSTFERTEYSIKATANAFRQLLIRLGTPSGEKVKSRFTTPDYLEQLTDWQRALYLSAFFGAEMSAPAAKADKNLYCPKISQNRTQKHADAGEQFMQEVAEYLNKMGVETNKVERFDADTSREDMKRLRLGIKSDSENLIRFFTCIGYQYNQKKERLAALATQYLKLKRDTLEQRERIAEKVDALTDGGVPVDEIKTSFNVSDYFIKRSAQQSSDRCVRPPADFPSFEAFCESTDVRENLTVPVEIESIEPAGREPVYDIGVEHEAHNFLADGFVVSNCGVRMVRTNLTYEDIRGREAELVDALFDAVPSGLGGGGIADGSGDSVERALERGVEWCLEEGYAVESDLAHCEDEGRRPDADASAVSKKARDRGRNQMGSLGSGNHFLEVQRVTDVYDAAVSDAYGLDEDQLVVLIHCGSRGLGHQVCNDYLRDIEETHDELLSRLPDKELAAAPAGSQLAADYYGAMCAAINFAWVNRQLITHRTREVFADVFGEPWEDLGMELLYDVAHNIAKREVHTVDGEERELFVHRKGATRAFPAGHPEVPAAYRDVGQPVIIPGSMGAGSYVLRGGEASMDVSFGSTAHGAGRLMSRTQAKDEFWGGDVRDDLEGNEVYVKANSGATIAEEAPGVYKDVDEVVRVSDELGIGDRVARCFPVCNIKG